MSDEDDKDSSTEHEHDGRSVEIDAGFYKVQVWGDPDDDLDDVMSAAEEAADRAREDHKHLEDQIDGGGESFA